MFRLAKHENHWEPFKIKKISPVLSITSCLSLGQMAALSESIMNEDLVIGSQQEFVFRMRKRRRRPERFGVQDTQSHSEVGV